MKAPSGFPSQRASNAENDSISWRHHECDGFVQVWDDILTPYILTPGSIYHTIFWPRCQYIVTVFWPLHDILTPPNSTSNGFVCYVQLPNVVYCYKYIIFMKVWVVQKESIIDTQAIIYMILILSYIFPSKYERQTKLCRRLFQGVKISRGGGGVQNTIFWPSGRIRISFGGINKSIITIQEILDLISI